MTGLVGATVSTDRDKGFDAVLTLPAASVAVTVMLWPPLESAGVV